MPRSKTGVKRTSIDKNAVENAIRAINGSPPITFREASKIFKVSITTLFRHSKKFKESGQENYAYEVNYATKRIFTDQEECSLVEYLDKVAKLRYGMNKKKVRQLAYHFAKANRKQIPESWETNQIAGETWMRFFMKRNKLSVRKAEKISQARSASFNKVNMQKFYDNLSEVHTRYGVIPPERIYNLDETGITTVQNPGKVVVPSNSRNVASATSGERGSLVTMIGCINAIGNSIPPLFVFPRVHFKQHMLYGAPVGSKGVCNPSGWSTEVVFLEYMEHFIRHAKPSREDRVLLLMDNHETHLSYEVLDLAAKNFITILTFPPHTSDKVQPLDVAVYGPFKTYYNQGVDTWMFNNPGKTFSIHNVAEVVGNGVFQKAFSQSNILSGFRKPGISPFQPDVWNESDFLPAQVTERPDPNVSGAYSSLTAPGPSPGPLTAPGPSSGPMTAPGPSSGPMTAPGPSPGPLTAPGPSSGPLTAPGPSSGPMTAPGPSPGPLTAPGPSSGELTAPDATPGPSSEAVTSQNLIMISPEEVQPFPQAPPRKSRATSRLGSTRIVTDTPEREAIRAKKEMKKSTTKKMKPPRTLFLKIQDIKKENERVRCQKCHLVQRKNMQMINCIECNKNYHTGCVSKNNNMVSEESKEFLCDDCQKTAFTSYSDLEDDDDNDDTLYDVETIMKLVQ